MIDTVVITIPENSFSIINHNKFSPSTINLFQANYYRLGRRSNFSCIQNPTKGELKKGIYKPRLTVTKRMVKGSFEIVLKIEFSTPKLLFGNNFDEIKENNFEKIIKLLHEKLKDMGVIVTENILMEAPVSSVHYSKNIPLTDYSTPYAILKEISKINLNQKLDLNQTDFRNDGHCLKFHSNYFEIVFYDKLKDLNKAKMSGKRAVEEDNLIQLDLFNKKPKPFEVLRMEVRINSRTKLKRTFKEINAQNDLSFHSIFIERLSQRVLLHFFSMIENSTSLLSINTKNISEFLSEIKILNPKIKIRKLLQLLGFKSAIEEMGIRGFREFIKIFGANDWYRLKKEYSSIKSPSQKYDKISIIKKALLDFKPLKLSESLDENLLCFE